MSGWKVEVTEYPDRIDPHIRFEGVVTMKGQLMSVVFGPTRDEVVKSAAEVKSNHEKHQRAAASREVVDL